MLREIVVNAQGVAFGIAKIFPNRAPGVWSDVLHGRRIGGRRSHNDRISHRAMLFEHFHNLGYGRALLPDRHIDADEILPALVDDRIQRYGRFAGLPVTDDQLALPTANRHHGIDRFDARLYRFLHWSPVDHARSEALERIEIVCIDGAFAVNGASEGVHYAPDHRFAHRNRHNAARAAHLVAFFDAAVIPEKDCAHLVLFEVQGDTHRLRPKFNQFAGHYVLEAVQPSDTIAHADHVSRFRYIYNCIKILNLRLKYVRDFVCSDLSHTLPFGFL